MQTQKVVLKDVNEGKVTSENSSHPVGTTVGTIGGAGAGVAGTIVAGALAGTAVGPAGAALGAAAGAVVGAMTGHQIAAQINPKEEDLFWRTAYVDRPYVKQGTSYDTYRPAYKYGVDSYSQYEGRPYEEIESDLETEWDMARGNSTLGWNEASPAARDAYNRVHSKF